MDHIKCDGCNDINKGQRKYYPKRVIKWVNGQKVLCGYCIEDYKGIPSKELAPSK
jgi:hypothetical protein